MVKPIKIIQQNYYAVDGKKTSYGILYYGKPKCVVYSKRELDDMLKVLGVKHE